MVYSGVGAIRGYATYLDGASRAATFMKSGGYIAIAFSGLNATNEVMYACTAGREGDCPKVAVKEYSQFGFSTGGAILGEAAELCWLAEFVWLPALLQVVPLRLPVDW